MFFKLLYIEQKKTKKSFAIWLTIFGSMVIPLITGIVMMVKPENFQVPDGINPWKSLLFMNFKIVSSFLFPMYVIYLIGLLGNIEYKSSNWKKLFVLPIRKELLISSKLVYTLLHILFAIVLFGINTLVFGYLAGAIRPQLNMFEYMPDITLLLWYIYHLFLSIIGIIGVQFILSIFFENLLVTLSIGLFLMIGSLIAAGFNWEYIEYVPYAAPHGFNLVISAAQIPWITKFECTNLVTFALMFVACIFFFKRKTVK